MFNLCDGRCGSATEVGVGEDSLDIVHSFHYFGDVISCCGGLESAGRDRISCAWSKWRKLVSLQVNHSIPLEEGANVYSVCVLCVRSALLYAAETWLLTERLEGLLASCEHIMLKYMSRVRWQDRITN